MRKKKKFNISLLAYVLCAIIIIIIIPCIADISGDVFRSKGRMSGYEEDSLYNDFIENNYEGLLEKTEYNTGIGKDIDKDTQDYYTFAIAYKKAVDYRVYVNNGENEKEITGDRFSYPNGEDRALYWVDVDRSGAKEYVQGYVQYFIDCHVDFLRIDFISWYEDGMDKGRKIGRDHGSANYRKVLEWIKEAAGDQIMISLVMPHLKNNGENEFGMGQMARINEDSGTGGWDTFSNFFGIKYGPSDRVIWLYLVALLLVVITLFVINRLLRMPLGRAWEALREDEIACRSLGLNPTRIKLTAFTISAAFAGFAGTLFAARQGFVSPESFTFAESAFVLAIVVLGGMGSQFAVILAAILLVVSRELMRDFNEYSMLMLGGLMVLMMIWRPQGLLPMTRPQLKLKNGQAKGEQA